MTNTQHFTLRCKQRRISSEEVRMAVLFGCRAQDRSLLGERNCETLLRAVAAWEQRLRTGCGARGMSLAKAPR